jgi:SAM-dependent methyltransferase|tara:strand:- start:4659 stop:5492 length:834 start_codon:yes stop_codon:yes gene_type:complete
MSKKNNIDEKVVRDFGLEWKAFNHQDIDDDLLKSAFDSYFNFFPFSTLKDAEGFDMGCGSGRWAQFVSPHVRFLNCIDPSQAALDQATLNMKNALNCSLECAGVDNNSLKDASQDFGYSLGVLHHIPDTALALQSCSKKLKSGAPFLLYLYYRFDNKPKSYYFLWKLSDLVRNVICRLPFFLKFFISQLIALFIYFPLARSALISEKLGFNVSNFPLTWYRNEPFYILRTDALDRFGTRLEQRFTKAEISSMMLDAGFRDLTFSDREPYWTVLAYKN